MQNEMTADKILQKILSEGDRMYPVLYYTERVGDYLYGFPADKTNALLRIDLSNGKVTSLGSIPGVDKDKYLACDILESDKKLILAPNQMKKVYAYDLAEERFVEIVSNDETNGEYLCGRIVTQGEEIYVLSKFANRMLNIDVQKMTSSSVDVIFEKNNCWMYGFYSRNARCYSVLHGIDYVMEYSLPLKDVVFHQLGKNFYGLIGFEDSLYLLTDTKEVLQWDINEKKTVNAWQTELDDKESVANIRGSIVINNSLYFLGYRVMEENGQRDIGIKIEPRLGRVDLISLSDEFKLEANPDEQISYSSTDKEGNVYFLSSHQKLYIYNTHAQETRSLKLKYGEELKKKNLLKLENTKNDIGKKCWDMLKEVN